MLKPQPLTIDTSINQTIIKSIEDIPYAIASVRFENMDARVMGILTLATQLNSDLLMSINFNHEDSIVALASAVRQKELRIIASNNIELVPEGMAYKDLTEDFVVVGKKFFDNNAVDQVGLVSLISKKSYRQMSSEILTKERYYREVTAGSIIVSFMLLMLWVTRRIRRLRNQVVEFSEQALGKAVERISGGDGIYILEQYFKGLSGNVIERTTQLQAANQGLATAVKKVKKTQEELLKTERYAALGHISGIMAHEMLNPINSLSLRTEKGIERIGQTSELLKKLLIEVEGLNMFFLDTKRTTADNTDMYTRNIAVINRITNILMMEHEERYGDLHFMHDTVNNIVRTMAELQHISNMEKHIEPVNTKAAIKPPP
ncbi:MAG: hypothetical protein HQL01_11925, partial [Nitrospirae bacterium]|nr:hypothetical protein [Nitrospirota bacterium]